MTQSLSSAVEQGKSASALESSRPALRVALMIESDGPGGAESVILTLADGLRKAGVDVRPVILGGGAGWLSGRLHSEGFAVHLPLLRRALDPHFAWELAAWVRRERIQLLHAHEFTMGFYAGVAGLLARVPHMITMHGGRDFSKARRRRVALRWSATRAHRILGVSVDTQNHLANALGLAPHTIEMVPNGVRSIEGDRAKIRAELNLAPEDRLIVAIGNLYKVKDHRTLVSAASVLRQRSDLPPWKLVIAGRGEEAAALQAQISASGLEGVVQLLGLRSDIPDLLAAADGWVMSSVSEGLPMALLEAMFARLPIVSTAVGGIPDLIRPGESGWLVPAGSVKMLADALAEMLANEARARKFGSRGFEIAHDGYGVDRLIAVHLAHYREAIR